MCLNIRAINEHIYILQQCFLTLIQTQILKNEAAITPDCLLRFSLNSLCQSQKAFGLEHWIATRKGHIGKWVFLDFTQNLFCFHHRSMMNIPRLRVMTAGTSIRTSSTINGSTESWPINHRVVHYTQYANHLLFSTQNIKKNPLPSYREGNNIIHICHRHASRGR